MIRTRFAPSPTGDLHVGGAWTALASWVLAKRAGGRAVLRMEDLDPPRVVPGSAARIGEDLAWLGLDWDEEAPLQSTRTPAYEEALTALGARGLTYPCDCSRAEIARVASAPHPGEEAVYRGTCRDADPSRPLKRPPAIRLRVPDETLTFEDGVLGAFSQNLARDVGDVVLCRGDGVFAYQLAVTVDDLDQRITDVVRASDLLASTPRQMTIARLLGRAAPRYWHVPLVVAQDGSRLAKRTPSSRTWGASVRELREAGVAPEAIVGVLAHGLGLMGSPEPASPAEVAGRLGAEARIEWRREPWSIPEMFIARTTSRGSA
jgi:glutamyl-tRNA synthetase